MTMNSKQHKPDGAGRMPRLVRRLTQLLSDLETEGYVLSLVSSGGQPDIVLHPEEMSLECDSYYITKPGVYSLGRTASGDMIAL